jgi:chemotaxis family two-component system response regulator Rcp1
MNGPLTEPSQGLQFLPPAPTAPIPARAKPVVVVVEDSPADLYLIRQALSQNKVDATFLSALDGQQAMQIAEDIDSDAIPRPDLIILDLNLPRYSGLEVLTRLRNSPRCEGLPIVVLSSSNAFTDRHEAERLGATRYFQKPYDYAAFMAIGADLKAFLPEATPSAA